MNRIVLQSVQFKASEKLEAYVNEKVGKLLEQDSSIIRADVTLFEGEAGNHRNQFCEILLSVPGENHFVKKNSESYEKSIQDAVKTLQQVIRKRKTRTIDRRRSASR